MINKPIPSIEDPEITNRINISHSPFVKVIDNDYLMVEMQYPLLHMDNAINDCYMREEVYEKLIEAAKLLPKGYKFKIQDAYRPFALQKELYEKYRIELIDRFNLHNKSPEEVDQFIKQFISLPHKDPLLPPVHTTGGAIDLSIIDEKGDELDMGTGFDEFTDKTKTDYFEHQGNEIIRDNRRLLYNIMTSVGFTNLPSEWWHYDYLDRFYAYYKNVEARYEGVFEVDDVIKFLK